MVRQVVHTLGNGYGCTFRTGPGRNLVTLTIALLPAGPITTLEKEMYVIDAVNLVCQNYDCATVSQCTQISGVLFRLKDNPQVLEEVLDTVGKHYSADLCQLIQTTLRRSFHQRPTTR